MLKHPTSKSKTELDNIAAEVIENVNTTGIGDLTSEDAEYVASVLEKSGLKVLIRTDSDNKGRQVDSKNWKWIEIKNR